MHTTKTWLLLTKTSSDPGWIADQYGDQLGSSYNWNHKHPNSKKIQKGDRIALWDSENLLGISIVDKITVTENQQQEYQQCPNPSCLKGIVNPPRTIKRPRYLCKFCQEEFENPGIDHRLVTGYSADYSSQWSKVVPLPIRDHLIEILVQPKTISSLRELIPEAFDRFLDKHSIKFHTTPRISYSNFGDAPNDDPTELQEFARRVRRGQKAFRDNLLKAYGRKCSITGEGPEEVLEAVHIVPHAQSGINQLDNGLLMRADLHHLFDDRLLSINPVTRDIELDSHLQDTPYWQFNGVELRPRIDGTQISDKFLKKRFSQS